MKKRKDTKIAVEWINTDGFLRSKTIGAFNKKQFNKKFSQLKKELQNEFRSDNCFDTLHIAKRDLFHKWFQ